jgi:nucleotide-binding universal stress UspA family protein
MDDFKVLIPLDGSRTAEHALVYVDALRALGETRVRLFSVVDETEDFRSMSPVEARERETNLLSTYLREVAGDIRQHVGIEVETRVVSGNPAACVLKEAHDYRPELMLISTHGRSGASRWRLGSVADKVIRSGDCNTLVIGPSANRNEAWLDARIMPPFRSVMVPLDGSQLAEQALEVARPIVQTFDSTLHLVRAVPIPTLVDGYGVDVTYYPRLLEALEEGAREYLARLLAKLDSAARITTAVSVGTPAVQLEQYATDHGIDLVVMTTHGRGGFVRAALGSVTDRLLGGPAPVLVVRARVPAGAEDARRARTAVGL